MCVTLFLVYIIATVSGEYLQTVTQVYFKDKYLILMSLKMVFHGKCENRVASYSCFYIEDSFHLWRSGASKTIHTPFTHFASSKEQTFKNFTCIFCRRPMPLCSVFKMFFFF